MRLVERLAIFCLAGTATTVLSMNNTTTFTRRRRRHLNGPPYIRQASGNDIGHTQIYCHNETQPPVYFSNYMMTLVYLLI